MSTTASAPARNTLIPLAPVERDTLAKVFLRAVDHWNRPNAMLFKEGGTWHPIAHREVEARAARVAAALQEYGLQAGDRVAILSENRPEWAITDYGVLCMGAVDVPIYPTLPASQVEFILRDSGARAVAVSTRQQLAKILEIRAQLPALQVVVSFDDPGTAPGVVSFAQLLEAGRQAIDAGRVGSFRERALRVGRDDLATLIYTSGTTGLPKGVMLTHFNLASNLAGAFQHGLSDMIQPGDTTLSFLPLSHVFSKLRARTGGNIRCFVSGGAPLSAEIARFFFAAGLPIYEGYGLTETSPVISVNKPGAVKLGSVGRVIPGVEVVIESSSSEILTRGPHVMKGYWQNQEATAEMIDGEGWLHTGDIGEMDGDGFLRITDRLKNIIVTAGGKNVAPQPLENAALMSPFVSQIVMLGDRRPYTIFLVVPDWDHLTAWASAQGMQTDRPFLAGAPAVTELLARETLARLSGFAQYELPKKVVVIEDEFTIDNGLLTPTMKVKRRLVEEAYRDRIDAAYGAG